MVVHPRVGTGSKGACELVTEQLADWLVQLRPKLDFQNRNAKFASIGRAAIDIGGPMTFALNIDSEAVRSP